MLVEEAWPSPRLTWARAFIWLACGLAFIACAACDAARATGGGQAFAPPPGSLFIKDVPFFAEDSHQCGPASLASMLTFHGERESPDQVAQAVYRPGLKGSLNLDLMLYARAKGLCADWRSGGPQVIVDRINQGKPLLVLVDVGLGPVKKLHYMVLTGYTPRAVRVNSGLSQGMQIAWPDFLASWERTRHAWLRIARPGKGGCP